MHASAPLPAAGLFCLVHPRLGPLTVGRVDPTRVYALRQAVLRPHQGVEQMAVAGEVRPEAATMGALTEAGEVVSTGCVVEDAPPEGLVDILPAGRAFRLRGMATRPDVRRSGVGTLVLQAIVDHVVAQGGAVLWCNARLPAVGFYERAGFCRFGAVFEEPVIGPHARMWRPVENAALRGATAVMPLAGGDLRARGHAHRRSGSRPG